MLMAEEDHFDHWEAADDDQRQRFFDDFRAFAEAVRARGAIVVG